MMSLDTVAIDAAAESQPLQQPTSSVPPAFVDENAATLPVQDDQADDDNSRTLPAAPAITPIDAASIHRICSGQVILDLATAVKELIENSLDARATHITLTLKAHGADMLEIADNGTGIDQHDYAAIAKKHHTSKLRRFDDLASIASYGFRGEALSSLAALGTLTLTTKTHTQSLGTLLSFDHDGTLTEQRKIARTTGTTVTLTQLFSTLPVRYKAFIKTIKREYARMLSVVQAYALITAGVRISVCQLSKAGKSTVFTTQGSTRLLDAITNVFGSQQAAKVQEVDAPLTGDDEQPLTHATSTGGGEGLEGAKECRVRGWVSKGRDGRSSNDRQYIYINQRPVDIPKLTRTLNDAFRTFSASPASASYPFLLLDLILPPHCYDVNVTPNKRTVMLHGEAGVLAAVRRVLVDVWAPSQQTFTVNNSLDSYMTTVKREMGRTEQHLPAVAAAADSDDIPASLPSLEQVDDGMMDELQPVRSSRVGNTAIQKRSSVVVTQHETAARQRDAMGTSRVKTEATVSEEATVSNPSHRPSSSISRSPFSTTLPTTVPSPLKRQKVSHTSSARTLRASRPALPNIHQATQSNDRSRNDDGWTITGTRTRSPLSALATSVPVRPDRRNEDVSTIAVKREMRGESSVDDEEEDGDGTLPPPPDPVRTATGTVRVDIDAISRYWHTKASAASPTPSTSSTTTALHDRLSTITSSPSLSSPDDTTTTASDLGGQPATASHLLTPSQLTRVVSKQDFLHMRVIGQFNLGFIIAHLNHTPDLFIIDQHAADEKYRYERLKRLTTIQQQPLLTPLPLHLSPAQSALLSMHLPVFTAHGFSFSWSGGVEGEGSVDGLVGLPWSKDKQFGVSDVHELLELLGDGVRVAPVLPKLLSVFASRACRSAVMVGDALDVASMSTIVRHMSEMEHPWACPHGRPTMRHLCDISLLATT